MISCFSYFLLFDQIMAYSHYAIHCYNLIYHMKLRFTYNHFFYLNILSRKIHMFHYSGVIIGAIASQNTSLTIVYSTVYSGADQKKYRSSACGEFPADRRIPRKNGHLRGKCFHLTTSSCIRLTLLFLVWLSQLAFLDSYHFPQIMRLQHILYNVLWYARCVNYQVMRITKDYVYGNNYDFWLVSMIGWQYSKCPTI